MLDAAYEEGQSWSGGREGGVNSRICPRSPAVATKREPWDLLPGGRRDGWVGYRRGLREKPRGLRYGPLCHWGKDCLRVYGSTGRAGDEATMALRVGKRPC